MENGSSVSSDRRPQVAVAVFILKNSSILLGRRLASVGHGTFALPGGRLEFDSWPLNGLRDIQRPPQKETERGESWEECAKREVKEETGLDIGWVEILTVVNDVIREGPNPTHFVTIIVRAELSDTGQSPVNMEPDKCGGWAWYEWAHLPDPLFGLLDDLVRGGFDPYLASRLI